MMTDIERRTIVAPADRERVALVRYALPAGGEWEIPVEAEFLGWADDIDPLEVAVRDSDGRLFLVDPADVNDAPDHPIGCKCLDGRYCAVEAFGPEQP